MASKPRPEVDPLLLAIWGCCCGLLEVVIGEGFVEQANVLSFVSLFVVRFTADLLRGVLES